jgi:hypothetical protein
MKVELDQYELKTLIELLGKQHRKVQETDPGGNIVNKYIWECEGFVSNLQYKLKSCLDKA